MKLPTTSCQKEDAKRKLPKQAASAWFRIRVATRSAEREERQAATALFPVEVTRRARMDQAAQPYMAMVAMGPARAPLALAHRIGKSGEQTSG